MGDFLLNLDVIMNVYEKQMKEDYLKLHPMIQKRFHFSTHNMIGIIGKGRMEKIWTGRGLAVFVLKKLSKRNILFPKTGTDVPFEIHNYPYKDELGREAHSLNRIFNFDDGEQRFDGTVVYSEKKGEIVEYLGLDHSMIFEMELKNLPNGEIQFLSKSQFSFISNYKVPIPSFLRGDINLIEWYDEATDRFYLDLKVVSKLLGPLFGFNGWFKVEYIDFTHKKLPKRFQPTQTREQE